MTRLQENPFSYIRLLLRRDNVVVVVARCTLHWRRYDEIRGTPFSERVCKGGSVFRKRRDWSVRTAIMGLLINRWLVYFNLLDRLIFHFDFNVHFWIFWQLEYESYIVRDRYFLRLKWFELNLFLLMLVLLNGISLNIHLFFFSDFIWNVDLSLRKIQYQHIWSHCDNSKSLKNNIRPINAFHR